MDWCQRNYSWSITIGDGAVIAAGAVVNSNVPKYSVSGGVPSKTISIRN